MRDAALRARIVHGGAGLPETGEACILVDGAWQLPGLNLSHWPGNTTPAPLRHDLSTGSALAFARLPADERRRVSNGATLAVNNHYDTDGTCALFAVTRPAEALPRAEALLEAARAGDFFQLPSEDALAVDALVSGLADPQASPLRADLAGLGDLGRWQLATDHLLEHLPAILDGAREPYRALWEPALERARADLARLATAAREDEPALDLTVWTARAPGAGFDPGRHALFGSTPSDRVLSLAETEAGTTCRLVLSTLSWFDLVTLRKPPRPDLGALAARLNEREGTAPAAADAWRAQDVAGASPELWFGTADHERFAEHCPALRPSRLGPGAIRREVAGALAPR